MHGAVRQHQPTSRGMGIPLELRSDDCYRGFAIIDGPYAARRQRRTERCSMDITMPSKVLETVNAGFYAFMHNGRNPKAGVRVMRIHADCESTIACDYSMMATCSVQSRLFSFSFCLSSFQKKRGPMAKGCQSGY